MIKRIIVEDRNGITVLNNPLKEMYQVEDIDVDTVGVALVRVNLNVR